VSQKCYLDFLRFLDHAVYEVLDGLVPNGRHKKSESREQTGESRQQRVDSTQQTADGRQHTADSRQQTADSRQQTYEKSFASSRSKNSLTWPAVLTCGGDGDGGDNH
jgi:hypothetical protein